MDWIFDNWDKLSLIALVLAFVWRVESRQARFAEAQAKTEESNTREHEALRVATEQGMLKVADALDKVNERAEQRQSKLYERLESDRQEHLSQHQRIEDKIAERQKND